MNARRGIAWCGVALCVAWGGVSGVASEEAVYAPREIGEEERARWQKEDGEALSGVEGVLRERVEAIQAQLWARGWPMRVARGGRTLKAQREGFVSGASKTLRSKHLCGKAVDLCWEGGRYPPSDHRVWEEKDELARGQGLWVIDAPSFRDRPHVELDGECDWDEVGLGPAGSWRGDRVRMRIEKRRRDDYQGVIAWREGGEWREEAIARVEVRHEHEGDRARVERAYVRVFHGERGESVFRVSTLISKGHGYERADWRWLEGEERLRRVKGGAGKN